MEEIQEKAPATMEEKRRMTSGQTLSMETSSKLSLLFVMDSLAAAGGEKSLVTLLSLIDYDKYDVSLQLFNHGGVFERFLPRQVKLLRPFRFIERLNERKPGLSLFISKSLYALAVRKDGIQLKTKARYYWRCFSRYIPKTEEDYDVAIAYSQCLPTYYVVEKVRAKKKIGWVNCIFHLEGYEKRFNESYYRQLDRIVPVSEAAKRHLESVYPHLGDKMSVYSDIVNPALINRLADEPVPSQVFKEGEGILRLLTVARLNKEDKGYDITMEACRILKERGLKFRWYAIGSGPYKSEMKRYIQEHSLEDYFFFLWTTPNPYCYMRHADIYVQTSRHEGYGLSIAEARILNRPVVTTDYDAVYNQMIPGKNGLVVGQNPIEVADAIMRLVSDRDLYESIVAFQKQEKKGNPESIEDFYALLK